MLLSRIRLPLLNNLKNKFQFQQNQYQQFKFLTTTTTRIMNYNFTITLNDQEERIANLLVGCAKWIERNPEEVDALRLKDDDGNWIGKARGNEPVELRIAGGWVRDKLLGADSDDIDISIYPDPITGVKFASLLEKYLEQEGKSDLMGKLTAIEAKPEQSKHLETATAIVEDLSIDFVHQRGQESYAENSRIPIVCFGTPLEDAERRDLTINALFYNLTTRLVEDHTQKGLNDLGLIAGSIPTIRTPLPPAETFRDDPLRVIRAVRVGAKLGEKFKFADDLQEAIGRDDIRSALKDGKKIARDRVGIEVGKMLMGNNPFLSMQIIHKYNLHPLIFLYEPSEAFPSHSLGPSPPYPSPDLTESLKASEIVYSLLTSSSLKTSLHPLLQFTTVDSPSVENLSEINHEIIKRFYLSCALLPFDNLLVMEKKKTLWLGEKVVRDGLKFKTSDKVWASKANESCKLLSEGVKRFGKVELESSQAVLEIALLLRNKAVHDVATHDVASSTRWNTSLFWSLVVDICHATVENPTEIIKRYSIFIERVLASHLETRAFALPLLNGNEILDVIDAVKGLPPYQYPPELSPSIPISTSTESSEIPTKTVPSKRKSSQAVSEIADHIIKWQLINPEATKLDCKQWLEGVEKERILEWVAFYALPVKREKGSQQSDKKRKQG